MIEDLTERREREKERPVAPGEVLLDRYRIIEWIGSGATGLVMRAFDAMQGRPVAIKIRHVDTEGARQEDQRFLREIQTVASLRSEHATQLFDCGALPGGTPYMVMEQLDGPDLRKLLAKRGKLEPTVAVDYVLQACHALAEAHTLGIVHRDVKPANLMLTKRADGSEILKVLDFGCAKAPGLDLTNSGSLVGTPAYMSPEQIAGALSVDARSDIWSVGALLYHLVEGQQPFDAKHFMDLASQVSSAQYRPMTTAPHLALVVDRCLKKRPNDRYASILELVRALAPFSSRPIVLPPPVPTKRPLPTRDIFLFITVLVIACGLTLAILAITK